MTTYRTITMLSALMTMPLLLAAQQASYVHRSSDVDFDHFLLSPEMVMQHQREIGLTAEQRSTITQVIKELQGEVLEYQWVMQEAHQVLAEMLDSPSIDTDRALAQVDKVLDLERQVKKAHFAHLIQIKNVLSPEQQEQLHGLTRHSPTRDAGQRHR